MRGMPTTRLVVLCTSSTNTVSAVALIVSAAALITFSIVVLAVSAYLNGISVDTYLGYGDFIDLDPPYPFAIFDIAIAALTILTVPAMCVCNICCAHELAHLELQDNSQHHKESYLHLDDRR